MTKKQRFRMRSALITFAFFLSFRPIFHKILIRQLKIKKQRNTRDDIGKETLLLDHKLSRFSQTDLSEETDSSEEEEMESLS